MKDKFKYILLFSGVFLVIYGITIDEVSIVFNKAIRICLECIGIG